MKLKFTANLYMSVFIVLLLITNVTSNISYSVAILIALVLDFLLDGLIWKVCVLLLLLLGVFHVVEWLQVDLVIGVNSFSISLLNAFLLVGYLLFAVNNQRENIRIFQVKKDRREEVSEGSVIFFQEKFKRLSSNQLVEKIDNKDLRKEARLAAKNILNDREESA